MQRDFNNMRGRIGVIAAVILALSALALYLYSERAVPPEPPDDEPPRPRLAPEPLGTDRDGERKREPQRPGPVDPLVVDDFSAIIADGDDGVGTTARESPAGVSMQRAQRSLREDLAARLTPGQIELVARERLLERLVTTINSLDGDPVPLRFRPLDHVPDLPLLQADGAVWRLPAGPDPRYRPYRALFDRFDATDLAELFDRYEPALEQTWQALGEQPDKRFRTRLIEVLDHLAEFDVPAGRPRVDRPEVLYEYVDPELERLSWGRKVLIRIGPAHVPVVQRKLGELADQLQRRDTTDPE